MTILSAPADTLTDGVVGLRLPSPEDDIATIDQYVSTDQLDGGWLPDVPLISGEQLVSDWLDRWNGRTVRSGETPFTFVVTVPGEQRFVGVVGIEARDDGAFDLSYGTAPAWRERGLASRATRLTAQWVCRQPGVRTVEALISQGEQISERVAVNAGFVLADALTQADPGAGDTVQLRYIMNAPPGEAT